jgi:hydroxymethylpyrimidine pyrophosphatase-like HAD family hydrolase
MLIADSNQQSTISNLTNMNYSALAADYDGTIASEGHVDDATAAALDRARAAGIRLLLVTGRELNDLFNVFDRHAVFDVVVAENGAVLYDSAARTIEAIAPAPPPELLVALMQRNVPASAGHSIVATSEPHESALRGAIRDLGLDWHVILNKGSVMALPASVTKATGLATALGRIGIAAEHTIAVGDAENDEAMLRICGLAVAVANALPSLKAVAHLVTPQARGAGVQYVIDRLLAGELE